MEGGVRVLSWNLFHGRSVPPAGEDLAERFAGLIARWEWDVALLQEVPPWWPSLLAGRAKAEQRRALTSRNSLLWLRRLLAVRLPDLMKSSGGGSNAVLARRAIVEHRTLSLRTWPERRVAQLVRLAGGTCVANYHGSARVPLAEQELERLWSESLAFAAGAPLVLGGDLNLRRPVAAAGAGAVHVAVRDVDHLFARGLERVGDQRLLDARVSLGGRELTFSDHPPLWVELAAPGRPPEAGPPPGS
jgi:endonuclease/exonuclease/phosphatase family metal-dependent hydrolase